MEVGSSLTGQGTAQVASSVSAQEGTTIGSSASGQETITDDEQAIYDRQIRLWGLEAQNRLRNSKVLLVGLSGCGSEVAKNLMLAGLKSLTLLDNQQVQSDDECCQFLISVNSVGQNRAEASRARCQLLNPNVEVIVDKDDVDSKDAAFFKQFDLVILIDQKASSIERVNGICRDAHIRFQAGGVFGWTGYGFFDFNDFEFLMKVQKDPLTTTLDIDAEDEVGTSSSAKKPRIEVSSNGDHEVHDVPTNIVVEDDDERVKKTVAFPSWPSAMNVDWSHKKLIRKARRVLPHSYFPIRALLRINDAGLKADTDVVLKWWAQEIENCGRTVDETTCTELEASFFLGPQLSPACAIVGAVIAQEAIKALSQNDVPLQNLFLYSAYNTSGVVCYLPPPV